MPWARQPASRAGRTTSTPRTTCAKNQSFVIRGSKCQQTWWTKRECSPRTTEYSGCCATMNFIFPHGVHTCSYTYASAASRSAAKREPPDCSRRLHCLPRPSTSADHRQLSRYCSISPAPESIIRRYKQWRRTWPQPYRRTTRNQSTSIQPRSRQPSFDTA